MNAVKLGSQDRAKAPPSQPRTHCTLALCTHSHVQIGTDQWEQVTHYTYKCTSEAMFFQNKKKKVKLIFYLTQISKILSFQHIFKIIDVFYISFFCIPSPVCILPHWHISTQRLPTFQGHISHMWLVAAIWDNTALEHQFSMGSCPPEEHLGNLMGPLCFYNYWRATGIEQAMSGDTKCPAMHRRTLQMNCPVFPCNCCISH